MRVEHCLTIFSLCPIDGRRDVYKMIVRTQRMIRVEDILAAVEAATKKPVFQEDLTEHLAKAIGCEIETQGWHGEVQTTVVCVGKKK